MLSYKTTKKHQKIKSSFEDFFVTEGMKRLLLSLLLVLATVQVAQAQIYYEEESDSLSFRDRVYFGGNLSLNIFGGSQFIDISPIAGYMITPQLSAGAGFTYQYVSREFIAIPSGNRFDVSTSVYGGRIFGRYNVRQDIFAYTEFESLNVEFGVGERNGEATTIREWVPGFFIGGGTFRPLFGKGGVNIMVLYNLLHDNIRSPYNSEWVIRGGVTL